MEVMVEMKDVMPTWPQTLLIAGLGGSFCLCCYLLSRSYGDWGPSAWGILAILALSGMGFLGSVFLLYIHPRYGPRAFPVLLILILGHLLIVAVLWRMGTPG